MHQDTIAAIATSMSPAGIGIVRISGGEAFFIIDRIFRPKYKQVKISEQDSHTIHYGYIVEEDEIVDEVLVTIMKSPSSYTTEDSIEINGHGGIHVMKRILEVVIRNGARIAEPGEFTKRAFLNGRIDLSQAEAVIDVINANNDLALKSSVSQLKGILNKKINDLRDKILYQIAFIESALDDPEHINLDGYPQKLMLIVDGLIEETEILLKTCRNGRMLKEGIQTVILGKPNAGKSSLLNILSGQDRAIVTDIEGTTRDVLEEQISLDGIVLNIVDTAGIRNTKDKVEKIGVERAKESAKSSDLILYVVDGSKRLDERDEEIYEIIQDKEAIVLLNKSDLELQVSEEELKEKTGKPVITISIKNENGIQKLIDTLKHMFFNGKISFNDQVYLTNVRHQTAVEQAGQSLKIVRESIDEGMPEDFYSIDLMAAYEELGSIIGESVGENLVNEIFSKFCTGK